MIFGGESELVTLEDFVSIDLSAGSLKWQQHEVVGDYFLPRRGAAMCTMGDVIYVFGGVYKDEMEKETILDEFIKITTDRNTVTAESIPLAGASVPLCASRSPCYRPLVKVR